MRFLYAGFVVVLLAVGACGGEKDDTSSPDAMPAVTPDSGTAAGAFMSECQENTDCDTNLCFHYNAKGPHCTHECERDEDCEEPSPGCNNKGVCKAP